MKPEEAESLVKALLHAYFNYRYDEEWGYENDGKELESAKDALIQALTKGEEV